MTKPKPKLDPEKPTAGFFAAPTFSPFEERRLKRRHLDGGRYVPMNTKIDGAEYCDPVFQERGMIGRLDTLKAVLAGPFVCHCGMRPLTQVIWVPPTGDKVCINEVALQEGENLSLHSGEYFDGARSKPDVFENEIREAWNIRFKRAQRYLLDEIDCARIPNGRRLPTGADRGMRSVVLSDDIAGVVYDTLLERVWKAGGYGDR